MFSTYPTIKNADRFRDDVYSRARPMPDDRDVPKTKNDAVNNAAELEYADEVHRAADCPPKNAVATNGVFFRWLSSAGYKSHAERGLCRGDMDPCDCAGLSCFRTLEALRERMAVHSYSSKKKVLKNEIVRATLSADHGVMLTDGTAHYTIWFRRKHLSDLPNIFKRVS